MSDLYYIIGGIAYGIFILQFVISWVAGEAPETDKANKDGFEAVK